MSLSQNVAREPHQRGGSRYWKRFVAILLVLLLLTTAFLTLNFAHQKRALAASSGPALSVDATAGSYAINPNIYGACGYGGPSAAFAQEIKLPLCRWGGDNTSRYNWQANASNSGVDYYFIGGGSSSSTPGANVDAFIDQNNSVGAKSLVTIPIIPSIEKSNAQVCAFSVQKYGASNVAGGGTLGTDWNGNGANDCANGVTSTGTDFTGNDPADTSTANSPSLQAAWVQHLVQRYGPSSQSGIMYGLDNEPSNWSYLHRDVVRSQPTYTDLINLAEQYAPAIKQADPSATIIAPDDIQFAWYPDWGGTNNMVQYLQAMKQYEQQHGQRILDIFSVHYPDANDNHWPNLTDVDAVRQVVDQNYPGTKIGFDEWNINPSGDPTGGALATADQLGIFARDQVAEAAYWVLDDPTTPAAYSFRMYRNYDGNGGQFGDTYLHSTSGDVTQLSVYGASRSSDGTVTIMVINKTGNDLTSTLALNGIAPTGNAQVYSYSKANTSAIVHLADQSVSSSGLTATFAADSLTMLVIPTSGQVPTPTPTPSPTPASTPSPTPTSTPSPTPSPTPGGGGGGSLPSPWQAQDIGSVGQSGSSTYNNGTYTVAGSGSDIWGSGDAFQYAYQPLSGDGTIIARVSGEQNTDGWAKAGVMMRESLNANSTFADMVITPGNGAAFQRRTSTGGGATHTGGPVVSAPYWVKLVRSGSTFTGSISSDGSSWTQVGSDTISMASSVYIGLAVTAHNNGALNSSTFDNVSVSGGATATWTKCANEGGTCSFSGTHQVRYGANGSYNYQTATGSIACNNATFGDPIVGTVKECDYQ